jgi:hypothetical protein
MSSLTRDPGRLWWSCGISFGHQELLDKKGVEAQKGTQISAQYVFWHIGSWSDLDFVREVVNYNEMQKPTTTQKPNNS